RRAEHHEADVLIVGGGVLGCAAAVALGRQGRSVLLLERSLKEPDRIVGELLQPGGVRALEELGLESCLEGIEAVKCEGYDVFYGAQEVLIPYPAEAAGKARRGKKAEGRSFHHGRFVQKLRAAAAAAPNVTVVETTAKELVRNGWTGQVLGVESSTNLRKDYYFAHLTIVADGHASNFRKFAHPRPTPEVRSKFFALELIDCDLPAPRHGHVILHSDSPPALLYQIGPRETRALIDVPTGCPTARPEAGGVRAHLRNAVLPTLPARVRPSFAAALDAIEDGKAPLRSMANSFLAPARQGHVPGLCLLGDAMNMRHPLTGGGMTVALSDVVLLAEVLAPDGPAGGPRGLEDESVVARQLGSMHWRRKGLASVINILAMALYSLFAADDATLRALQLGCFRYFQLGGICVDGPVSLLAGILRNPLVLFLHFFAVAIYAMWVSVLQAPLLAKPWAVVSSPAVFLKACVVIFPYIWSE
ncbi:squalene monooxygenase erg1, partial [Lineolata rhizophorae]